MQVPLLDLKGQYAPLRGEIERVIAEVCNEQRFVLGPNVTKLEAEIADYSHAKHGLGVSSGTDALLLALMALGIGPGDEVVTSPFTFFATAGVVARLGARPLFCDIDARTYNLDPAVAKQAIHNLISPNRLAGLPYWGLGRFDLAGMDRMRNLVCQFYDGLNFGQFVRKHGEHHKGLITDILIGDLDKPELDVLWPLMDELRREQELAAAAP